MMNFVYTLCSSTPGQIQYGGFKRALAKNSGDLVETWFVTEYAHSIAIISVVSPYHYAVNLSGVSLGCIDTYAVLELANDVKLHVFATEHKANTYHEHLI